MGKLYSVTTGYVAATAAQDIVSVTAGSARSIIIHEVRIGQSSDAGDTEAEMLRVDLSRFIGAFTIGTGGAAVTPEVFGSDNLPASNATARRNDTTATTGGTEDLLVQDAWNVQAGFQWLPTPEMRPSIAPTDAFVVNLPTAPADSIDLVATVIFEEF